MKFASSQDDCLYFADHADELVQEQCVGTLTHEGNWSDKEEEVDAEEIQTISFYPRKKPNEPLEWKAIENRLKPLMEEPPKVELKALPDHLEYAFLQGDDQLPVVISSTIYALEKNKLLKVLKDHKRAIARIIVDIKGIDSSSKKGRNDGGKNENNELIPQWTVIGWRVCIDYRKLNDATRKDHFPLLFIHQMLERLAGHEYYCFLDGFSRYFQILIAAEDQENTTFTCPYGIFAYKQMSFGLCNTLATFQHCMMAIFHEMIEDSMKVKEGIILGHKVFDSGIEVSRAKIESISKLPYPANVKAIQSFLGHEGFYRMFINDFSKIAPPMNQLLVKNAPFIFSEECIQAFDKLKHELTQSPIMAKHNLSLPFELMCDASDYAIRAVLGQRRDKHFQPIHYASKTINEAQENYTTIGNSS
ncbi:reverse transcriptase domain-containing protein [Tanacetum coccineum]